MHYIVFGILLFGTAAVVIYGRKRHKHILPVVILLSGIATVLLVSQTVSGDFGRKEASLTKKTERNSRNAKKREKKEENGENTGETLEKPKGKNSQNAATEEDDNTMASSVPWDDTEDNNGLPDYGQEDEDLYEDVIDDDPAGYILPQSNSRYLTKEDVASMEYEDVRLALREIYARHGCKFKTEDIQLFFNTKFWYKGTIEEDAFNENVFNKYEKKNVRFLSELQDALN